MTTDDILLLIIYLLVIGVLFYFVYLTTKIVGSKASKSMRGKHIHVIETISLGMDKRIHLIKAGKEYILVASSGKELKYLTTIELEQPDLVEVNAKEEENPLGFNLILNKYITMFREKNKKTQNVDTNEVIGDISETGEIRNTGDNSDKENVYTKSVFKDNLNKLRSVMAKNIIGDGITNDKKKKPG